MRDLRMYPDNFNYELVAWNVDDASAETSLKFDRAEKPHTLIMTAPEAEKIGKWFLGLAKEIRGKKK